MIKPTDLQEEKLFASFRALRNILNNLTEKEQLVFGARFGIAISEPKTLAETGKILGVTRERIRQIEAKAIVKAVIAAEDMNKVANFAG